MTSTLCWNRLDKLQRFLFYLLCQSLISLSRYIIRNPYVYGYFIYIWTKRSWQNTKFCVIIFIRRVAERKSVEHQHSFHYRCISMGICTLMIRHLKKFKIVKISLICLHWIRTIFVYVTQLIRLPKTQENKTLKQIPFWEA